MKTVPQSFKMLEDGPDLITDIGNRSRICYKSEPQGNEAGFVNGIIKKGHNSCLEMRTLTLKLDPYIVVGAMTSLCMSKYMIWSAFNEKLYVTGTVRAWREWFIKENAGGDGAYTGNTSFEPLYKTLRDAHPLLFADIDVKCRDYSVDLKAGVEIVDEIPEPLIKKHTFQGVHFTTNRAVTHEIVRHRPVTFLQESQRYCSYLQEKFGKEVTFIEPTAFFQKDSHEGQLWRKACEDAEKTYFALLKLGHTPQAARTVLPNSCKTEIIVYCSLKQWEHIFAMRCSSAAEPSMQELMYPTLDAFKHKYPGLFNNPQRSVG